MNNLNFYIETSESSGIGEHNSIAVHVPGDNNANNCLASRFYQPMRHGTTVEAVNNFENRLNGKAGHLNISGHGAPGLFETGSGQSGWDENKQISLWNSDIWMPVFSRLKGKQFPILTIFSCSTGANDAGANLLWEMAKTLGVPVRARTGLTSCNGGITFQSGSTWQTATPSVRPVPITETPHPIVQLMNKKLFFNNNEIISTDDSNKIRTCKVFIANGISEELSVKDAQRVAQIIFNESVQAFSGELLAFITQRFEFEFDENDEHRIIEVDVYNDSIAVVKATSSMYFLPPNFKLHFSQLIYSSMSISGLIKHPLRICKHTQANITPIEADNIIQNMSRIGSQCNFSFFRQGNVLTFNSPANGIVNSQTDFQTICSGAASAKGITRSVYVVAKINWCGTLKPGIIGCANTPGICMVVVRYTSSLEAQLWTHEFGHSKGLSHRDNAGAVMHSVINYGGENFNSNECQSMRQLGIVRKLKKDESTMQNDIPMNLKKYVNSIFIHGIPILEVIELSKTLSSDELDSLIPIFRDSNSSLQVLNIATLWCISEQEKYFDIIKSKIVDPTQYDDAYPISCLQCDLLMSLGYLANTSEDTLNFLIETSENNSRLKTSNENSHLLLVGSINGLALSGNSRAIEYLKNVQNNISNYIRGDHQFIYEAMSIAALIKESGLDSYYKNS